MYQIPYPSFCPLFFNPILFSVAFSIPFFTQVVFAHSARIVSFILYDFLCPPLLLVQ